MGGLTARRRGPIYTTFEGNAAVGSTGYAQSCLCSDVFISEGSHQRIDSAEFEVSPVDQPHPFGFVFDDGNLAVLHLIAEGQGTTDPESLSLGRCNLVPEVTKGFCSLRKVAQRPLDFNYGTITIGR